MAKYGTFLYGDGTLYGDSDTPVFPIQGVQRVPWVFTDIVGSDSYEFAVNPLDASVPSKSKTVSTQYTSAGVPINFEGRSKPETMSFSGTILHEAHYNAMVEWATKSTQINVVDDLGRSYWIYISNFSPKRNYSHEYPWRHEYTVDATVLSWD